jgi:CheY-like chemotaxis protein
MKRFLFLDDMPRRHERFAVLTQDLPVQVEFVWDFDSCIAALKTQDRFDTVFLDHDLNDFNAQSVVQDMYGAKELTGYDLCCWIVRQLPQDHRPSQIIVHSHNPVGAQRMIGVLRDAGMQAKALPFS